MRKKIYVAGAITGHEEESYEWRKKWKKQLEDAGFNVFDPYLDGCEGTGLLRTIVNDDIRRILTRDVLLVNGNIPSWGTALEIGYARQFMCNVYTIYSSDTKIPIWLEYHSSRVFSSLEEFIGWYKERTMEGLK